MSIFQILNKPFPYDSSPSNSIRVASFFGIFIFGFLMLFQPFNLDQVTFNRLLWIAFVYSLITFTCIFTISKLLSALFPSIFNENNWTTGKHILLITGTVIFVGLVNYLLSPYLVGSSLSLYNAIWFQGITIAIALIPISIFTLLKQNRLLKKFKDQAEVLDKKLQEKKNKNTNYANGENDFKKSNDPETANFANGANTNFANRDNDSKESYDPKTANFANDVDDVTHVLNKIVFAGDYHNEKVEVYIDDLYIITSASNYIKLFHLQKEKLVYSILRSTIKKTESIVLDHPNFFKCHRAFIINLDKVVHVEGNAQGYKIRIEGHDELIPVSRNLNSEFSDKLLAFRKQFS